MGVPRGTIGLIRTASACFGQFRPNLVATGLIWACFVKRSHFGPSGRRVRIGPPHGLVGPPYYSSLRFPNLALCYFYELKWSR